MKKVLLTIPVLLTACFGFAQAPCSDLFFSEYIEGSSQNKALEVYNPTSNVINLSNYHIYRYLNGGTAVNDTLVMAGFLAPGATYNIVNPDTVSPPNAALLAVEDTLHTVTFFNGDDALALFNGTTMIDIIGDVGGADPGAEWAVDTGSTKENTLVRKANIFVGTTNWVTGATQWDVYGQNDFSHYGSHTMNACSGAGINDEPSFEVTLYPNPTTGPLTFTTDNIDYSLQIFDLTGKVVMSKTHLSKNTQIDMSGLSNGIYMVKLNQGGNQLTRKIILRK